MRFQVVPFAKQECLEQKELSYARRVNKDHVILMIGPETKSILI